MPFTFVNREKPSSKPPYKRRSHIGEAKNERSFTSSLVIIMMGKGSGSMLDTAKNK